MLFFEESENPSMTIGAADSTGNRVSALHLAANLMPGRVISITVEVLDEQVVKAHAKDLAEGVGNFISTMFDRAEKTGIPVPTE